MDISINTPLGTGDALIVSSAVGVEALGLLSVDGDMHKVVDLPVYTTTIKNDIFDGLSLINKLDDGFKEHLIKQMGETEFNSKYPVLSSP
jgi:hypothetical protein